MEDYFEEEEEQEKQQQQQQQQQQQASEEVATTLASEITNPSALLCSSRSQREGTQCARCDVGLCVVPCFAEYQTKVNL